MTFEELLNSPLPSQAKPEDAENPIQESVDDMSDGQVTGDTDSTGTTDEGCNGDGCSTEDTINNEIPTADVDPDVDNDDVDDVSSDGDDDIDPDDLSDDELMELDRELSGDALDSVAGHDNEVSLDPEEEIKADNMMSMAATTLLLNDEMNAQEKADFVQNDAEVRTAINEGFMTDSDVAMLAESSGLVTEGKYNKKMIIRLDAEAKKKQLYALAVNVTAAAKHDPDYMKLKKVMKMRKILRTKLERKYHAEATKRMRIYFKRLNRSSSSALSKIGKKFDK